MMRKLCIFTDLSVSHRVEPQCVELYVISKAKGVQTSVGSDEEDVRHRVPGQGPLEVIEQLDEPIGRPILGRKHPAYLDDYCSLLETVQDLDQTPTLKRSKHRMRSLV